MIRAILFTILFVILFFFLINNRDQAVQIHFLEFNKPVPLYLLFSGTFLSGLVAAIILIFPGWIKLKLETRRQKKEIDSLEEQIGALRTLPAPTPPPPPISPVLSQGNPPETL
jgi:uncharacterized integral membrane protein